MAGNIIKKKITEEEIDRQGIRNWPVWSSEVTAFDWEYGSNETCYILEGEVIVHAADGDELIQAGDFVTFPRGLKCTWEVRKPIRKHYSFS